MPALTCVLRDGSRRLIDPPVGASVMEVAVKHDVEGIGAECGGAMCCATCHVYVDPTWFSRLPKPDEAEIEMLASVAAAQKATSRLSCQITMTDALDGLVIVIPDRQTAL